MTNFDKLVSGGPEAVAYAFTRAKVAAIRRTLAKAGIEYSGPSNGVFQQVFKEHYDWLTAEYKEEA